MSRDQWDGLLAADEEILWQGRPDTALAFNPDRLREIAVSLFFTGFSIYWMVGAAQSGGFLWLFGLIFMGTGISQLYGVVVGDSVIRAHTWYTLTNQRAFIATDLPKKGKALKGYPIVANTQIDFRSGDPASIYFGREIRKVGKKAVKVAVGFERIADAQSVYNQMRDVQQGISHEGDQ